MRELNWSHFNGTFKNVSYQIWNFMESKEWEEEEEMDISIDYFQMYALKKKQNVSNMLQYDI